MNRTDIHTAWYRACLCLLASLLLFACSKPHSDEQQIASAIEQLQQATEQKQLGKVMQHFSDAFLGNRYLKKAALQARIYFHFRHNRRIKVYVSNIDIHLDEQQARVSCHLLLTGSQDIMPDKGRLYRIESGWRKDKGKWRIFQADWQDVIEQRVLN